MVERSESAMSLTNLGLLCIGAVACILWDRRHYVLAAALIGSVFGAYMAGL